MSFQCNEYSNRKEFQGICLNMPWFLTHPIAEQDKKRVGLRKREKRRAEIKEEKFIYSSLQQWTFSRAFKKKILTTSETILDDHQYYQSPK